MKDTPRRDLRFGLLLVLCAGWIQTGALAQVRKEQMAKEDVVDVPAIHDGLCVSNLFQTNMVLQRDEPIAIWGWADPGERVTV